MKLAFILSVFMFLFSSSALAKGKCQDLLWGFVKSKDYMNNKYVNHLEVFRVKEWSVHQSFNGLLLKRESLGSGNVEVLIRFRHDGKKKLSKTESYNAEVWSDDKKYLHVSGFKIKSRADSFKKYPNEALIRIRDVRTKKKICERILPMLPSG